ncbi:hypothetical protein QJS66_04815 [Kocuria rhizophila]|nr:hypothetical protein QJS66_04815 [Kocuria rhizophila]
MVDYTLVVAVSMAAAAQYLAAVVPVLVEHRTAVAVAGIAPAAADPRGSSLHWAGRPPYPRTLSWPWCWPSSWSVRRLPGRGTGPCAVGGLRRCCPPRAWTRDGGSGGATLVLRAFSGGGRDRVETITHAGAPLRQAQGAQRRADPRRPRCLSAVLLLGVLYLTRRTGVVVAMDPDRQLLIDGHAPAADSTRSPRSPSYTAQAVTGADSVWAAAVRARDRGRAVHGGQHRLLGFPGARLPAGLRSPAARQLAEPGTASLSPMDRAAVRWWRPRSPWCSARTSTRDPALRGGASFAFPHPGRTRHWNRLRRTRTSRATNRTSPCASRWPRSPWWPAPPCSW